MNDGGNACFVTLPHTIRYNKNRFCNRHLWEIDTIRSRRRTYTNRNYCAQKLINETKKELVTKNEKKTEHNQ